MQMHLDYVIIIICVCFEWLCAQPLSFEAFECFSSLEPFRSKLAAAVLRGVDYIWPKPGAHVLYLGVASGTIVSHVSDITAVVYAVESSHRSRRDLVNMAKKRTDVIPILEDASHPAGYRMLVRMVDVIFSDVAQPDQVHCYNFFRLKTFLSIIITTMAIIANW